MTLIGGESLARQFSRAQHRFVADAGERCRSAWVPEVVGFPESLPQIARLAGLELLEGLGAGAVSGDGSGESFTWEGIDGSRVEVHLHSRVVADLGSAPRLIGEGGGLGPAAGMTVLLLLPAGSVDAAADDAHELDGTGTSSNPIGAPAPRVGRGAPVGMAKGTGASRRFARPSESPSREAWFDERGARTNRRCELLLREAELWCAAAYGTTSASGYPRQSLERLWDALLARQARDSGSGTIKDLAAGRADQVALLIEELEGLVADALATLSDAAGGHTLLANPAPVYSLGVTIVHPDALADTEPAEVFRQPLADGAVALRSRVAGLSVRPLEIGLGNGLTRPEVWNRTGDPDVGVRVFQDGQFGSSPSTIALVTSSLIVNIDDEGLVTSCVPAHRFKPWRDVIAPGGRANLLHVHDTATSPTTSATLTAVDSIDIVDRGPLVGRVRVARTFGSSTIVQTYELTAGSTRLDIHTELLWREPDCCLTASFPLDVHTEEVIRETAFGHVASKLGYETEALAPANLFDVHSWVLATEPRFGAAILTNGSLAADAARTRTPDDHVSTTVRMLLSAQGWQSELERRVVTHSILPTQDGIRDTVREAQRLTLPVRIVPGRNGAVANDGRQPTVVRGQFLSELVECVKAADDDSGDLIVRLYESHGKRTELALQFAFAPVAARVVDLLEEPTAEMSRAPLTLDGVWVKGDLRPFQILTLRITPPPHAHPVLDKFTFRTDQSRPQLRVVNATASP